MKTFKDKFVDHQNEIQEKMNEWLNSLATTQPVKCLSCGEKDRNYPTMQKYAYGNDGKLYLFQNNDIQFIDLGTKIETENQDKNKRIGSG